MVIYLGLFRGKKICTSLKNLYINYDTGMKKLKEELGKDTKASWELYTKQTNNSVDLTMQAQRRQVKQLNHKANQNSGEHEEAK